MLVYGTTLREDREESRDCLDDREACWDGLGDLDALVVGLGGLDLVWLGWEVAREDEAALRVEREGGVFCFGRVLSCSNSSYESSS